jgi:hypothetical protein
MRPPRVQFTVRRTMIAVAIIACFLGGSIEFIRLRRLAKDYRVRAARHAKMERQFEHFLSDQGACLGYWSTLAADREKEAEQARSHRAPNGPKNAVESWAELSVQARDQAAFHARLISKMKPKAAYYTSMRQKWERATFRPWEYVQPDSAPPE